ncbi:hypothetical protein DSOUD_1523 [Desulfuromonas soudanensis]|uniref:Outer membrane protein beta-barrel domain-containing protein n=1 Tax=Desulfuromonas soudanensis TaxID=1603606 RepID=A0A0M4D074_9BACT|nr:hypothetical protein [Desulfuromonas soudanensis]ALC16302.1 hypothetical protein DSOUD_1523 [Desulfuromonas soudanensis]
MFKVLLCRSMSALLLLLLSSPVYAGGIGIFLSGGEVEAKWDGDITAVDSDGWHRDFGLTIDSNLATDRLFNYRMELGRAEWEIDSFNKPGVDAELDGLVMTHTFGFGGLIAPPLRLWFGPELRFTRIDGELDGETARDIDLFGYGLGAAVGLNYNLPGRLTLAAKSGFVMMRYLGNGPNWNGSSWQSSDYDIDEDLVYLGVSMYFRTTSNR